LKNVTTLIQTLTGVISGFGFHGGIPPDR